MFYINFSFENKIFIEADFQILQQASMSLYSHANELGVHFNLVVSFLVDQEAH